MNFSIENIHYTLINYLCRQNNPSITLEQKEITGTTDSEKGNTRQGCCVPNISQYSHL